MSDPGRAYLAGLLHDIGIIANLWALPQEFRIAFEMAKIEGIPLHEAERATLGFTHCDSGGLLAEKWGLPASIIDVIAHHHLPSESLHEPGLVALVHIADLLCRMSGLNYGYMEQRQVDLFEDSGFALLAQHCPNVKDLDWARLTFEMDSYLDEVHTLVRAIYRA
jgi:HD-like signal output (HDOD) protein